MLRRLTSSRPLARACRATALRNSSSVVIGEPLSLSRMSSMALGGGVPWPLRDYDHEEMWVQGDGTLVLLSVEQSHCDDLMKHWDDYDLYEAVGCPLRAQWGVLHRFVDDR